MQHDEQRIPGASSWTYLDVFSSCEPNQMPYTYICKIFIISGVCINDIWYAYVARNRGATRRVPATNGYPLNLGSRTRSGHRVTGRFRGPPGTEVPTYPGSDNLLYMVSFAIVKLAWQCWRMEVICHFDYTSLRRLKASVKPYPTGHPLIDFE